MDRISDRWLLALVIGLLSLLPLLAYLQYQWLGRLSEGEAARMHENLTVAAEQFSKDVATEVDQLYEAFLVDPQANDRRRLASQVASRLASWKQAAPHSGLLGAIYHVRYEPDFSLQLARFDASAGAFRSADWPAHLASWQAYFDAFGSVFDDDAVVPRGIAALEAERARVPALVVPIPKSSFPRIHGVLPPYDPDIGFLLLELDQTYLEGEFFPSLVRNHFQSQARSEYDIVISSVSDSEWVLYASRPGLHPRAVSSPDVSLRFGLRSRRGHVTIYQTTQVSEVADAAIESALSGLDSLNIVLEDVGAAAQAAVREQLSAAGAPDAPLPDTLRGANSWLRAVAPPFSLTPGDTWQLDIKHRAGSLEAAVTSMRWRNLAITSAILLLLGIAVCLLYLALRRAREVAARQMEFVAGVSHELRTPLAVIGTAAENLADGVVEGEDQRRRYGELITRESRRLTTMVQQMLALAGADSATKASSRPVSVQEQLEKVLSEFEPEITREGFTVTVHIPPDLPRVETDPMALATVLRNLISNALKYSDGARMLHIRASVDSRNEERVVIAVRDEGMGIPPRELSRIFEPFYRGQRAREEQIRGSGIGLNLSRKLVETQGGQLTAESTPGEGSTFRIHLPVCRAEEHEPSPDLQSA